MRIAAFGDVHGDRYLNILLEHIDVLADAEIILMAGDVVNKGRVEDCERVLDILSKVAGDRPIYGVLGNEEYDEIADSLRERCAGVRWLWDELAYLADGKVALVGTRGVLDEPTHWQRKNVPGIDEIYRRRLQRIEELLQAAKSRAQNVVLLTHYAPMCNTLRGEPERIWSQLGSRRLTSLIRNLKPTVVIHAHAHRSIVHVDYINGVKVFNVSLPATGKPVAILLGEDTLDKFLF